MLDQIPNYTLLGQFLALFAETPFILEISIAVFISAFLTILGKYLKNDKLIYIFKPLTTALILSIVFVGGDLSNTFTKLVSLALIFSLAGDVYLMLPKDRFIEGLASFLTAHIILIVAFFLQPFGITWWWLLSIAIVGLVMFRILSPHLKNLKIPVAVYIFVIVAMAWIGCEGWLASFSLSSSFIALGSVLFLISDGVLALNRFRASFKSAEAIILTTYFLAIWCFSLSTLA